MRKNWKAGGADKAPRQQDPGEMRHRSERESITGSRSGGTTCTDFQGEQMRQNWKAWAPIRGETAAGSRSRSETPTDERNGAGAGKRTHGAGKDHHGAGRGADRSGEQMRKNLHGVEHHPEPIRAAEIEAAGSRRTGRTPNGSSTAGK